jgi:hypothetical protein
MHISALSFPLVEVSQVAAICYILVEASLHMNAIYFESILVLYHLIQEHVKEEYVFLWLQSCTLFIFSSLVPTCLGFKHLCFCWKECRRAMHMHLVL